MKRPRPTDWALSIPNAGSLILTHRLNGLIIGLKDVAPQNRPPVKTVFFAFRIMLAIGFFMIAAALIGAWLLWRGMLFETRWYLRIAAHAWWTGFVAVIAGWVVTESGRQPWVVQGMLRTADATSPHAASTVLTSLVLFVIVYAIVFCDGHLLYQPADRAWAAGPCRRAAGARFGVAAAVVGPRRRTRGAGARFVNAATQGTPWANGTCR